MADDERRTHYDGDNSYGESEYLDGTCILFHQKKGWGFIRPDGIDQADMFVHQNNIEPATARLEEFQMCRYRTGKDAQGREKAIHCNPGSTILDRIVLIEHKVGLQPM
jgi:cold shock CspA family protein